MVSPDRPANDVRKIVEAIVEQLTVLPGANVSLRLEIDAELPSGLDRNKVRTLTENAKTLDFIDSQIDTKVSLYLWEDTFGLTGNTLQGFVIHKSWIPIIGTSSLSNKTVQIVFHEMSF